MAEIEKKIALENSLNNSTENVSDEITKRFLGQFYFWFLFWIMDYRIMKIGFELEKIAQWNQQVATDKENATISMGCKIPIVSKG